MHPYVIVAFKVSAHTLKAVLPRSYPMYIPRARGIVTVNYSNHFPPNSYLLRAMKLTDDLRNNHVVRRLTHSSISVANTVSDTNAPGCHRCRRKVSSSANKTIVSGAHGIVAAHGNISMSMSPPPGCYGWFQQRSYPRNIHRTMVSSHIRKRDPTRTYSPDMCMPRMLTLLSEMYL